MVEIKMKPVFISYLALKIDAITEQHHAHVTAQPERLLMGEPTHGSKNLNLKTMRDS